MSKFLFIITLTLILFVFLFLNLGRIIDATSNPKKVDLLVCLGGGIYKNRVEKTKELFENGYLKSNTIIFTGYQKVEKVEGINNLNPKGLKNTYEEVLFVKEFMKENGLKSATFISEAPHSRRILLFATFFGKNKYEFNVVGSKFEWDAENYYKYPQMRSYVKSEILKLFYNFFLYGFIDTIGLKDNFENSFKDDLKYNKKLISANIF
jgi:hypothetical protein